MWLIVGTVPERTFPLYTQGIWADSQVEGDMLLLPGGIALPVSRGTTALAATAILACETLGCNKPRMLLTGDCGTGEGSLNAYEWLAAHIKEIAREEQLQGISFHYFYPDLDAHNKLYMELESMQPKPLLVADAGFMYVAKMSGYGSEYDLFTPDAGELAFLADEKAPHPFYTRGFLLANEWDVKPLLARARHYGNCPANLIVKGRTDYILCDGELLAEVSEPSVGAMECIGGTGDIVTGFVTAYLCAGEPVCTSSLWACRAARLLGEFCQPNPATQVADLIVNIPEMLKKCKDRIEKG